jgi:hypothetical protein
MILTTKPKTINIFWTYNPMSINLVHVVLTWNLESTPNQSHSNIGVPIAVPDLGTSTLNFLGQKFALDQ